MIMMMMNQKKKKSDLNAGYFMHSKYLQSRFQKMWELRELINVS